MDKERPGLPEYLETVAYVYRQFLDGKMTEGEWLENPLTEWVPVAVAGYDAEASIRVSGGTRLPTAIVRFDGDIAYVNLARRRRHGTDFCKWERNFHWDDRDFEWLNCSVGEIASSVRGFEIL